MSNEQLRQLLERVRAGELSAEDGAALVRRTEASPVTPSAKVGLAAGALSTTLQQLRAGALKPEDALRAMSPPPQQEFLVGAAPIRDQGPLPPIAVVGMSGRFPGAADLSQFWTNLSAGQISVTEVPPQRWQAEDFYHPDPQQPGKSNSKWGGFLDDLDQFDPLFFAISPREAELMDPQQRLFLMESWRALEEAGYGSGLLDKTACGVFVGCGPSDYLPNLIQHGVDTDALAFTGNSTPILAARISFLLNLRGPSLAVDTACSSSLVAVILACESIAAGTCAMAIAGGVSVFTTPQTHLLAGKAGMLSSTGRCHTFDERADGFVPSEGVGVVVLKRLDHAERDGDHIHGVIRASGLNQDGKSNGITAPSATSQTDLIRAVYDRYGIDPAQIHMVEAHGTGTKLGDPIEVSALSDAFGKQGDCVLGSVKANIGHASSAAGIAGLLKVLLCLKHRKHVPMAGFTKLNPHLKMEGSPFRILSQSASWPVKGGALRMAALSSFGFSGTNAHLVVSEAPGTGSLDQCATAPDAERNWHPFPLSAQDEEGLRRRAADLLAWLEENSHVDLGDLSYTLCLGRSHFRVREMVVAQTLPILKEQLARTAQARSLPFQTEPEPAGSRHEMIQVSEALVSRLKQSGATGLGPVDMARLAACYRAGINPEWPLLFGGRPKKLSLPAYPFKLARYWIPAELVAAAPALLVSHPLIDRLDFSASTGTGLVFEKTLKASHAVIGDHCVLGVPTLPGMAYLETAFAAARLLVPSRHWKISTLEWHAPCRLAWASVCVRLILKRDGNHLYFQFESEGRSHCSGVLEPFASHQDHQVDLDSFLAGCDQPVTGEEIRKFYAGRGLDYGPSYRGLKSVRLGSDQLAGFIHLPQGAHPGRGVYHLHPALADAALQAAAWLIARPEIAPEGLFLPKRLAEAVWLRPLSESGTLLARLSGPNKLDLVLVDAGAQVCARISGLELGHVDARVFHRRGDDGMLPASAVPSMPLDQAVSAMEGHPLSDETEQFLRGFRELEVWARARLWQVMAAKIPSGNFDIHLLGESFSLLPKFRRLLPVLLELLCEGGYLLKADHGRFTAQTVSVPERDALLRQRQEMEEMSPALAPFTRLVWACTESLWPILQGEIPVTRILFPSGSAADVAGIYGDNPLADSFNRALTQLVGLQIKASEAKGPFRILEIGGGTASTSTWVWEELHRLGLPVSYHFTDISPAFVRQAQTLCPYDFVHFDVFDLEGNPEQKVVPPYDLVIAANVVHATRSIASSLDVMKRLLSPGGTLVLNEITMRTAFGALTFGLTDGWWAFTDGELRLPGTPLLDEAGWVSALHAAGFEAPSGLGGKWLAGQALDHRILVAHTPSGHGATALPLPLPTVRSNVPAEPPALLTPSITRSDTRSGADEDLGYVRRVLASVLKIPEGQIEPNRFLEEYGIDSLVTQQVVSAMEPDLGALPATLVFECPTAQKLATYLRHNKGVQLDEVLKRQQRRSAVFERPGQAQSPLPLHPADAVSVGPQALRQMELDAGGRVRPLDVAIVGMAGRYPLADDLDAFWENLQKGRDCIGEVPADRWDWRAYFDADPQVQGKSYTANGGFIRDADCFDARFFRISPREADGMDPQERLFLETSWHCVEHAGYDPLALGAQSSVGVFVGVMNANYSQLAAEQWRPGERVRAKTAYWSMANRVSFCLNFRGPSLAVDTACSSSLSAIHLACHSLLRGECQVAVAGGVNLILHPAHLVCLSDMHMLSPTGRCRSFGEGADGFVDGEGVGALMLKPLAQAMADGDSVLGVIKASAMNCGGRTTGYTVPSPEAQGDLIAQALASSGLPAAAVGYIEAHGTGTALGDPIELAGLNRAFGRDGQPRVLGSVKSNIGHSESAAGVAGLTKILLQMQKQTFAPSLHAEKLNPKLDMGEFRLLAKSEPWSQSEVEVAGNKVLLPRSAGVSSFGAGGANVHLILQAAPGASRPQEAQPGPWLFPFSARDAASLKQLVQRHLAFLSGAIHDAYLLQDMSFTLQLGRTPQIARLAVIAEDEASLRDALQQFLLGASASNLITADKTPETPSLQGKAGQAYLETAVENGDLTSLARVWVSGVEVPWTHLWTHVQVRRRHLPLYPFARKRHWLKRSSSETFSGETRRKPGLLGLLDPRLSLGGGLAFGVNVAADSSLLRDHEVGGLGTLPGVAGLMLAAEASKFIGLEDPWTMTQIQWLKPLTSDLLPRARFLVEQEGGQIGFRLAVDALVYACGRLGSSSTDLLAVPPFKDVKDRFSQWQTAERVYGSLRGLGICHGPAFQVMSRFASGEQEAFARLEDTADLEEPGLGWSATMLDGALQTIGGISSLGLLPLLPFRLGRAVLIQPPGRKAWCHAERLSGFCFRITLYADDGTPAAVFEDLEARPFGDPLANLFYVPQWSRIQTVEQVSSLPASVAVFFASGQRSLAELLKESVRHGQVLRIERDGQKGGSLGDAGVLGFADEESWTKALAEMETPRQLVFLASTQATAGSGLQGDEDAHALLVVLRRLAEAGCGQEPFRLTILTKGASRLFDEPLNNPWAAALFGLARSAARELPNVNISCVDFDRFDKAQVERVLTKNWPEINETLIAIREGLAYRQALVPVRVTAMNSAYRQKGRYLIVGGAGGLGWALAQDLVQRFQAKVILVGRRELEGSKADAVKQIREQGGQVHYLRADATDPEALARAFTEAEALVGPIHGVFHCALVLADRSLRHLDADTFSLAFAPKMRTCLALDKCLAQRSPDFLAFFSSAQSFLGNSGQANYAAGCTFMDAWAQHLGQNRPYAVRVLNWGFWGETGSVATPEYSRILKRQGILPISTKLGLQACERVVAGPLAQVVPFRAEPTFLAQLGVEQERVLLARRPAYPSILQGVQSELSMPEADADSLDRISHGLAALDQAGALSFFLGLVAAGLIQPGGEQALGELPSALMRRFGPLFRASIAIMSRFGLVRQEGTRLRWAKTPEPADLDAISRDCHELAAYVHLLRVCAPAFAAVLTGRQSPADLLFPNGSAKLVAGIYQGHLLADGLNQLTAQAVASFVAQCPADKIRILEVGAGTGATTRVLLPVLQPFAGRIHYEFSDLSPAFVKQARGSLAGRYPFASFAVRDISRPPLHKDELGQFDLVVAANVLHATADLRTTLEHIRMLMRPNGMLVLNEVTANSPFTTFTFGLLDGWWAFKDDLRLPGGPLLDRTKWQALLAEHGFHHFSPWGFDGLDQHVLLSACGVLAPQLAKSPQTQKLPEALEVAGGQPEAASVSGPLRLPDRKAPVTLPPSQEATKPADLRPFAPDDQGPQASADVQHQVELLIVQAMAQTLEVDPQELSVDVPHSEFGLDSILGVEVISRLNKVRPWDLSPTDVFNYPTIRQLAAYIVETYALSSAGEVTPKAAPAAAKTEARATGLRPEPQQALQPAPGGRPGADKVRPAEDRVLLALLDRFKRGELSLEEMERMLEDRP